jgi:uridine kinase
MIGDKIKLEESYLDCALKVLNKLSILDGPGDLRKKVWCIAGESGSGKSVMSHCLQKILADLKIKSTILHIDDYYKLPPLQNHAQRMKNINWVGPNEINFNLLTQHISEYKANAATIVKPLVNFQTSTITEETLDCGHSLILIVEGTYSFELKEADEYIFLSRNYIDTLAQRVARGREAFDPDVENILSIEHQIVRQYKSIASVVIDKHYAVE